MFVDESVSSVVRVLIRRRPRKSRFDRKTEKTTRLANYPNDPTKLIQKLFVFLPMTIA